MERKIGEIFEFGGEWYQCVESNSHGECSLFTTECGSGTKSDLADKIFGRCSKVRRKDNKGVIFKKLEKVGEPYEYFVQHKGIVMLQPYKLFATPIINGVICNVHYDTNTIDLEIKQNKEDMEDKKLNLKPFDIQKAREGKPVCTRDGRRARIICFDAKRMHQPIIALITQYNGVEYIETYYSNGRFKDDINSQSDYDLMMLPEKKEGWVNVYRDCDGANITKDDNIYSSKDAAISSAQIIDRDNYVATVKINWEE